MTSSPWIASPLTWIVISVIASTAATAFSIAWAWSLRRVRELEEYLVQREVAPAEAEARDELARQLEEVSAQVNRLADGQDFLARLVSDRRPDVSRPKPEPPRLSTPH
jgi:hypothetical protein